MKRVGIVIAAVFVVVILFIMVWGSRSSTAKLPHFVPGAPAAMPAYTWDQYNWNTPHPFFDSKVWLWTAGRTNGDTHFWLYDLQRREIAGELFNGGCPQLWCPENGRVLCLGPDPARISFKRELFDSVGRLLGRKIAPGNRTETFWILDLKSNHAERMGMVEQYAGTGSSWSTSPNCRFGYTTPTSAHNSWIALCDLKEKTFQKVPLTGWPTGWWDEHTLLVQTTQNTFELFDVIARTSRKLFGPDDIVKFLTDAGLTNTPVALEALANWNGRAYDFHFGPKDKLRGLGGTNSFLFALDRSGPSLKLLYRDFAPQWGGHLDADATHYLYQGEPGAAGKGGDGAVYLRNLTNGTTATIVPPGGMKQYSIPRFYGNEILYFTNRVVHRIGLDGSNDAPLIPMSASK